VPPSGSSPPPRIFGLGQSAAGTVPAFPGQVGFFRAVLGSTRDSDFASFRSEVRGVVQLSGSARSSSSRSSNLPPSARDFRELDHIVPITVPIAHGGRGHVLSATAKSRVIRMPTRNGRRRDRRTSPPIVSASDPFIDALVKRVQERQLVGGSRRLRLGRTPEALHVLAPIATEPPDESIGPTFMASRLGTRCSDFRRPGMVLWSDCDATPLPKCSM
jgi:hypothetical protein